MALSGDGKTALIGGPDDNTGAGAVWVFTRSGETWSQQGSKLTGKEETGEANFGTSVALSEDGDTALIGAGLIDGTGESEDAVWVFTRSGVTWAQQGPKLGTGAVDKTHFGSTVALSGDGDTALIGAPFDNSFAGSASVFTRSGETWSQDGEKLTGSGQTGGGEFGDSVALSADGNTALIGGSRDGNEWQGSAWIFTRSGETWTQQGSKLTGTDQTQYEGFGQSVALSADGNTALIGAPGAGAAYVFTRSGSTWTQQSKLTGTGETGGGSFGHSVALSSDGNMALIGGPDDNSGVGAAWVFTRSGETWSQEGSKLTGTGETGKGRFGEGVALSADGDTALFGGPCDGYEEPTHEECKGAAWVFTRSDSTWTQQGGKLTGTGEVGGGFGGEGGHFGSSVALSGDGNMALVGGPYDSERRGAVWVFTRAGETWSQQGGKLTGTGESERGEFGDSLALSGDGNTALIGAPLDSGAGFFAGAAWRFTRSGETWKQDGSKIVGAGETGSGKFGEGVALSEDGGTALIGGPWDNADAGAVWPYVFLQISLPPQLSFGSQTTSQPGPVLWVPVKNTGPTPLTLSGAAQIGGTDAGDFTIPSGDDLCENMTLAPEQVCSIGVQFTASENGPRNATLSLDAGNDYTPTVSLTGTGVAPNSEPPGNNGTKGEAGPTGTTGPQGSTGPTGTQGPTGPEGKEGPAGKVEIVTCTKKGGKQTCTTKLVTGPVKFTTTASTARATLSRHGKVFAIGSARTVKGHIEFLSSDPRVALPHGRYTLTITHKAGRHITETRQAITIT